MRAREGGEKRRGREEERRRGGGQERRKGRRAGTEVEEEWKELDMTFAHLRALRWGGGSGVWGGEGCGVVHRAVDVGKLRYKEAVMGARCEAGSQA